MKEISLTKGYNTLVDDEDYERVSQFKWYAAESWQHAQVYACSRGPGLMNSRGRSKISFMHRFILGPKDCEIMDHHDGNGLNNQRANLRVVTQTVNRVRVRRLSRNKTGYRGVSWAKNARKYIALIYRGGKKYHLGYFDNLEEAGAAYDVAASRLYGIEALESKLPSRGTI